MFDKIFKDEKNTLIAYTAAGALGFAAIVLGFKAAERRNTLIQALKDLKKELFPILSEIAAASGEEDTPSGESNPYRKSYEDRIKDIKVHVLKAHGLKEGELKKTCLEDYKRNTKIVEKYTNIERSIEHAFKGIAPEISCHIPHHLTGEAALELQAAVHKSVLVKLHEEVSKFRSQGKSTSLDSARFANIYYKTLWSYDAKKQAYINQDLDELEVSADQIRLAAIETFKKDESFREDLEELEEQNQRAVQALLLGDRDATIFIEAVGTNLGHLNKSVRCC